jgi:hypothetical protein
VADPLLRISRRQWRRLFSELAARGRGERESGAFLLTRAIDSCEPVTVHEIVFFDDLHAGALTGIISLPSVVFGRLWRLCEDLGMRVAADIHTHGNSSVAQSHIDASNPLVAAAGHLALIAPNFAQGRIRPADLGVHRYLGDHQWHSSFSDDASDQVRRTWW